MFLTITRTFKAALKSFIRNSWLSIGTSGILMLSLYVIGILILITFASNSILRNIQQKASISIYFKPDVEENAISQIKKDLEEDTDIQSVEYISKEKALDDFKRNNAGEQVILDSLKEIGDNPLLSSLVIRAKDPNLYQKIYDSVNQTSFKDEMSRINYGKNKEIINKLNTLINSVKKIGLILEILLIVISVLIIYNAVRLSIYSRRFEIEVMRLVGASNAFIRLPYVFEGILYGTIASLISMLLLFLTVRSVSPYVSAVAPATNVTYFYLSSFWKLFALQFFGGIFIGVGSSWISMRK
ncbi:MAG: permease-like cell division protein FtsX, partial [Patescibacteria group bacterium]